MQTFEGHNTAGLRRTELSQSGVTLFVEEEKSKDDETDHYFETVAYMAVWEQDSPNQEELEWGNFELDHNWTPVSFK